VEHAGRAERLSHRGVDLSLDTRPIVAGVLLGLLTYKPQFGILFPIVLAANGQWLVVAVATATTALLVAASAAVFGLAAWVAFFTWLPATGEIILGDGRAGLNKLQSLFGLMRWLGAGTTAAWIAQGLLIAACAAALVMITRDRRAPNEVKSAALATGVLLARPYLYIYDFPVLSPSCCGWGCGRVSCPASWLRWRRLAVWC
jgi:arabinofuranan 3-O-arabinosyltransferase